MAPNPVPVPIAPTVTTVAQPNVNTYNCTLQQLLAAFGVSSTETFLNFEISGTNVILQTGGTIGPTVI